jgi:cytochrome c553
MNLKHRLLTAAFAVLTCLALDANAVDALRGKTLYSASPPSGGATCSGCHGTNVAQNISKILIGANNPTRIQSAINNNTGGMAILAGKWTAVDIADVAAYIGNPNVVANPIASLSGTALAFPATVQAAQSAASTLTLSNTGTSALTVSAVSVAGSNSADFLVTTTAGCGAGQSLAAGTACSYSVIFNPQAVGARSATLTISHNAAGGLLSATFSGQGTAQPMPSISLDANQFSFGSTVNGTAAATKVLTVSNSGNAPLNLSSLVLAGTDTAQFTKAGTCTAGSNLAAGGSCTVILGFTPNALGNFSASLVISGNATNGNPTVTLSGTGIAVPAPVASIAPSAVAIGDVTVGIASGFQSVTLTNSGSAAMTLGAWTVSDPAFRLASNTCTGSLAAGTNCSVAIQVSSTVVGSKSANLAITSNAPGSPHTVALSANLVNLPTASPRIDRTAPIAFADTTVGQTSAIASSVISNAGTAAFQIATMSLGAVNASDFLMQGNCAVGLSIAAGASCRIDVVFSPTAIGVRTSRLNVSTNTGTTLGVDLGGRAIAVAATSASLSATSLAFPSTVLNSVSAAQRVTLTNTGNQPISVDSATLTGAYRLVTDSTTCATAPFSIAPGLTCQFSVVFEPKASLPNDGVLMIKTAVPGPILQVTLTGVVPVAVVPSPSLVPTTPVGSTTSTGVGSGPAPIAAADPKATTDAVAAAPNTIASPFQNVGAGGCSMSKSTSDPMLPALIAVSLGMIIYRRFKPRTNCLSKIYY